MAVYGTPVYGDGTLYGFDVDPDSPIDLNRRLFGGWAPWLPAHRAYERQRCWQIGTVDSDHAWDTEIAGLSTGSERRIRADGVLLPEDALTLQIADPTGRYLEAGADVALLAPGALVGLRKTVRTALAGPTTTYEQTYRVTQAPSLTRDRWGRDVLQTQAEDWLRAPLSQAIGEGVPTTPLPTRATGSPLVYATAIAEAFGGTWLDVAAGLYSVLAGGTGTPPSHCTVIEGTRAGGTVPWAFLGDGPAPGQPAFTDWLGGGAWPSYRQVLDSLCQTFGWRAAYDASGYPVLMDADRRADSGCVVSCDPAVGGAFPVPWERYQRAVQRAAFTRVEVWYAWLDNSHPPVAYQVQAGAATSTHPLNPHTAPLGRVETLTSNVAAVGAIGGSVYDTAGGVAAKRLRDYLGQADVLTLAVDSACLLPAIQDEVLVAMPEDDLRGWYAFTGATIPLSTALASWQLQWVHR